MSAVIPTSAGAFPFYDDLHCKKFAYSSESRGVLPAHPRGIKILIGVSLKRIRPFYCCSEHDQAFIWYVQLAFTRSNPTSVRTRVFNGTKKRNYFLFTFHRLLGISSIIFFVFKAILLQFEDVTLTRFWLAGHFDGMFQWVLPCRTSDPGELGKSKTTSLPLPPSLPDPSCTIHFTVWHIYFGHDCEPVNLDHDPDRQKG